MIGSQHKDKSFSIHHLDLQVIATEMLKYIIILFQTLWIIYFKKKKKKKNHITLGKIVMLFQEIINLYIMDKKQYRI